jgi:hypothetical protein
MKKIAITSTLTLLLTTTLMAQPDTKQSPKELFVAKCSACHSLSRPTDMSKVVAPMIMGVMRHVKMSYPNKDKAVAFMKDYVLNPSKEKSICKPKKIKRFGLMPSQKGVVSEKELDVILPWVFDNFPPKGFRGMGHRKEKSSLK